MALYLYDDAQARRFEPFALTRPASELCGGALITRHRWAALAREPVAGLIVARHLGDFAEFDSPPVVTGPIPAGTRIGNSRCLPTPTPASAPDADVWMCEGRVAAVRLGRSIEPERLRDGDVPLEELAGAGASRAIIEGSWVDELWDFVRNLTARLEADIPIVAAGLDLDPAEPDRAGIQTTGPHRLYIERGAVIEPYVFFDLKLGPVLIRRSATVQAFTRVIGPCVVGAGSIIGPDRIGPAFIGERCRVHGELAMALVLGHSNKAHDGFVGHSYLGRWVNLGAGTITSNLKNTYGPVQLWTPTGVRTTGLTFLGSFVGDYARTGIGTRLTTGCVVGAGANLLASMGPKYVPPFSWGDSEPFDTFGLAKFLEVAERQMARRDVALTESTRRCLTAAHTLARR